MSEYISFGWAIRTQYFGWAIRMRYRGSWLLGAGHVSREYHPPHLWGYSRAVWRTKKEAQDYIKKQRQKIRDAGEWADAETRHRKYWRGAKPVRVSVNVQEV